MVGHLVGVPSLGQAWPLALSSFVEEPQYRVTAHCSEIDYSDANWLINLYADVGDQSAGEDFRASALFRPQPGLLLAVRYSRMPKPVAGRYYQQPFGLVFTEESFQTYCGGRFDALPDPFEDLDAKLFEELETPSSIDLEEHIQKKYGQPFQEQNKIWLEEDANNIAKLASSEQRSQMLERFLAVLAGANSLIVQGLDQTEDKRRARLLALRQYLPLQTRSYLTFVTNVLQPESVGTKATFLGLGYGLAVSEAMRSKFLEFDNRSGTFPKDPDSDSAMKTASHLMDALLRLPPEQYLQNPDGYLDSLPVDSDVQKDKQRRIWELGAHYRCLVVMQYENAESATDYLEEYCTRLASPNQRMDVVTYVLDKCAGDQSVDNLARTVRILSANEKALTAPSNSIDLPKEVSERMMAIVADGTLSFAQLVDFSAAAWTEKLVQQDPWADLLIDIISQSAAAQEEANLGPESRLLGAGELLGPELNSVRYYARVMRKTNNPDLDASFMGRALRTFTSPECVSTFLVDLGEETLPWHRSFLESVLEGSETIWDLLLASIDNVDGLLRAPEMAVYVGCALSVLPELKVPSSFWRELLELRQTGVISEQHMLGVLRQFSLGESDLRIRQHLDWEPETLDVLVNLIPESDAELVEPLLEIPPSFSSAVDEKAASLLVEGSKAGKFHDLIPTMTGSLGSVQGEDLTRSLALIALVASKVDQENNANFEPLVSQGLVRIKGLEYTLLLDDKIAIPAEFLEEYFGRDASWHGWFKNLINHLNNGEYANLSSELSQIMRSGSGWEYSVTEGTRLWLEQGVNPANAEGLLRKWFLALVDAERLDDIRRVLPPIIRSFVHAQENTAITNTFISFVKTAWGNIHEIEPLFDHRDDTYLYSQMPMIIQYATQSDLRNALSEIVLYFKQHGNAGSALEKGARAFVERMDQPAPDSNPEAKKRGQGKYENLSEAAVAALVLHEARVALDNRETGIPIGTKRRIKREIDRAVQDTWGSNYDEFTGSIVRMLRGNGQKNDNDTFDSLFPWWSDSNA